MTKVLTKTKEDIEETLVNNYIDTEGNNQTEEVIINTVHKDVCTFIFLDEEQLDFQEDKVVIKNLLDQLINHQLQKLFQRVVLYLLQPVLPLLKVCH